MGAQAPVAVGVGFALKYKAEKNVAVCYLGDAAMNQGAVFEAMNMAAAWSLPVLFVIENNKYGMGTDIRRVTSVDKLYKRALAFDMAHSEVDGMNVVSVYEHCSSLVGMMKANPHPHLLEVHTYRYKGHSVSDPGLYRTKDELSDYQKKDPITQLGQVLMDKGVMTQEELTQLDKQVKQEVREAESKADEAPAPRLSEVWTDVLSN